MGLRRFRQGWDLLRPGNFPLSRIPSGSRATRWVRRVGCSRDRVRTSEPTESTYSWLGARGCVAERTWPKLRGEHLEGAAPRTAVGRNAQALRSAAPGSHDRRGAPPRTRARPRPFKLPGRALARSRKRVSRARHHEHPPARRGQRNRGRREDQAEAGRTTAAPLQGRRRPRVRGWPAGPNSHQESAARPPRPLSGPPPPEIRRGLGAVRWNGACRGSEGCGPPPAGVRQADLSYGHVYVYGGTGEAA